jgi:hypothetical protein
MGLLYLLLHLLPSSTNLKLRPYECLMKAGLMGRPKYRRVAATDGGRRPRKKHVFCCGHLHLLTDDLMMSTSRDLLDT